MGCDIHLHIEIKVAGKWLHATEVDVERDYRLFTKMANVRNYYDELIIEPISLPKGLPGDVTESTKFFSDEWDSDGHSHSWLSSTEINELEKWATEFSKELKFETRIGCKLFKKTWLYKPGDEDTVEDYRVVFWFDN